MEFMIMRNTVLE